MERFRLMGNVTFLVFLFFLLINLKECESLQCKDEYNKNVDWFYAYKLPKIEESEKESLKRGAGYYYFLPQFIEWKFSEKMIDSNESIIANTLSSLAVHQVDNLAHVFYNDQPPSGPSIANNGHTKGIIKATAAGGFWLMHSLPHFPIISNRSRNENENFGGFPYPKTGYTNGQMFLCLTLSIEKIDNIANILMITRPHVFDHYIPTALQSSLPTLNKFIMKKRPKTQPFLITNLTCGALDFLIFAKGPKLQKEIYSEIIAPILKTGLKVQTWLNGPGAFPSNCSSNYKVINIEKQKFPNAHFTTHTDHSKWAAGVDRSWICISDLNRMEHQKMRGGAALCTVSNRNIWNSFSHSVEESMPCP